MAIAFPSMCSHQLFNRNLGIVMTYRKELQHERQLLITAAIAEIRELHRLHGIDAATLRQTAHILERLASHASLFSFDHFPVAAAADQTSVRYQLHIEPDQSYGLYLNTQKPGKSSAVHNHGTWVVIVAVQGEELNRIYRRTDDGGDPGRGTVELHRSHTVRPGAPLALSGDDIHSIHVEGNTPTLHFHLYGRALETLTERVAFNLETGETSRYNQTHWRPSVIAG